jgi:integral membrane sensor domain MASE1
VGFVVLVGLAVIGVLLYLRRGPWPWLVAGAAAAAVLVFQVAGDAFGPALASFVVGGLLVAASAVLLIRRSREGTPTASA